MNAPAAIPVPAAVSAALAAASLVTEGAEWTALPGGRTNRVWQVAGKHAALVVKLYREETDNPLFPNDPADEMAVLRHLKGHGVAPDPLALITCASGRVLVYHHLAGLVGAAAPEDVARLLARVHALAPPDGLRRLGMGSEALSAQTGAILAATGGEMAARLRAMAPTVPHVPEGPVRFLHTDVVPANIVLVADGPRLIDWQCPALGDPCEDLASYLSPAMRRLYGAAPLNAAEQSGFLDVYGCRDTTARYLALAPLYHWRIAAYCAWAAARGSADYAAAMPLALAALQ